MADDSLQRLVAMANQIAANLAPAAEDQAAAAELVAGHLRRFWARSMRESISAYVQTDGSGLDPVARAAIERL